MTITIICCYCHRIKVDGEWIVVPDRPATDRESHGICPDCAKVFYPPKATRFGCHYCKHVERDFDGVPESCDLPIGGPCVKKDRRYPWD